MLEAEAEVCVDCGNVHMEGGPAPETVEECVVCGGPVTDVEVGDILGL